MLRRIGRWRGGEVAWLCGHLELRFLDIKLAEEPVHDITGQQEGVRLAVLVHAHLQQAEEEGEVKEEEEKEDEGDHEEKEEE